MSGLVQPIKNGAVEQTNPTASALTTGTTDLGKDAFLKLLVTQMKYQDPLNPNTDTQFVAQLATFSQLEQMQNLSQTTTNSQAFGLVGKDVIVKSLDTSGATTYNSGTVDFVTVSNGKVQLSIQGNLYTMDQLDQVIDSTYIIEQGLPSIDKEINESYDKSNPADITFEVNLGKDKTVATDVAVIIDDKVIDAAKVTVTGNNVTISKDALSGLDVGSHNATVVFNDALYTTVSGKIKIVVKETSPVVETSPAEE